MGTNGSKCFFVRPICQYFVHRICQYVSFTNGHRPLFLDTYDCLKCDVSMTLTDKYPSESFGTGSARGMESTQDPPQLDMKRSIANRWHSCFWLLSASTKFELVDKWCTSFIEFVGLHRNILSINVGMVLLMLQFFPINHKDLCKKVRRNIVSWNSELFVIQFRDSLTRFE